MEKMEQTVMMVLPVFLVPLVLMVPMALTELLVQMVLTDIHR
jgi:hypothetical protein